MIYNRLTDEQLTALNESFYIINDRSAVGDDDYRLSEMAMRATAELQECRKAAGEPVAVIGGGWHLHYIVPPRAIGMKIGDKLYRKPVTGDEETQVD